MPMSTLLEKSPPLVSISEYSLEMSTCFSYQDGVESQLFHLCSLTATLMYTCPVPLLIYLLVDVPLLPFPKR